MTTAKRILRFVKGTIMNGIKFTRSNSTSLVAYCDSDFAGDLNDKRSVTGILHFHGRAV